MKQNPQSARDTNETTEWYRISREWEIISKQLNKTQSTVCEILAKRKLGNEKIVTVVGKQKPTQDKSGTGTGTGNQTLPIKLTLFTNSSNTSFSFKISIGKGGSSVLRGPSGTGAQPIFHTKGRVRA